MKYKIHLVLLLFVFGFYVYLTILNPEEVRFYFGGQRPLQMSVAQFIVIAFALGIVTSIIVGFLDDIKNAITGWKKSRRDRRREEFKDLVQKARSYDLKGDREKAVEQLNRLARRAPDMEEAYTLLADIYVSMKEHDKAIEVLNLAEANLGKKESILFRKAKIRPAMKDLQKMEGELKDVLHMNESNLEALSMLRDLYISKKRWDEAYETEKRIGRFIKTEDENSKLAGIRYEKACALFERQTKGDYESIIKELKDIISEDKRFIPAYILLAEIYKRNGKLNEAGRVYGRGYSKTGHIIFLSKMEDLYIDRGDPGVILKIYRRILDVSPKNNLIEFLYARLCLRLEMIDEAIDTLKTLFSEGAEFKGMHKAMAEAYMHRGQMEKAVEEFRKAFPAEHVYIPFRCDNCQSKKVEWADFCGNCYSWNTINVRKEDFLRSDTAELRVLYESEDWVEGGQ
ncbi:MAG: tetratricopeptide repeat protein [Syntrophorhabdus sp. PtaU1.Bin002]|nr:MAG: tetratricopeptide repeat protein [Syntrophorhabdus sp. PtaB.Bin006]OPY70793.1 MAG: tetratricopeptide repeat protein [Syntrophorhabdus sp. PtaU1.Bin002]